MKLVNDIKRAIRGEANIEKLKQDGLKVGNDFSYGTGCFFDPSCCFLISIGNNVTFSSKVHLLAHDASLKRKLGYSKVGRVIIGDECFLGANVTVLPGVVIGYGSIIGAGSVVTKDVPAHEVWAGNPARKISTVDEYLSKIEQSDYRRFGINYKIGFGITEEMKSEMLNALEDKKYILVE